MSPPKHTSRIVSPPSKEGRNALPSDVALLEFGKKTPTSFQRHWLLRGLNQVGGKLPLFLDDGKRVSERTIKSCTENGWVEPCLKNPIRPDWQICRLTPRGRALLTA